MNQLWELSLNLLAAAGLYFSAISFHKSSRTIHKIQQSQKDVRQSQFCLLGPGEKNGNNQHVKLKPQNQVLKVTLQVPAEKIKNLTGETFSRTYNDFKIGYKDSQLFSLFKSSFMESETGGQFLVDWSGQEVRVDIRQCNMHQNLVFKTKTQVIQKMTGAQLQYESVRFNLITGCDIIIAGILSYSIQKKQWILLPSFMMRKLAGIIGKQQVLGEAFKYLQNRARQQKFNRKISLIFILFFVLLRTNYIIRTAKKLFAKITKIFQKQPEVDFDTIKQVIARESDKLRCQCGKTLNVVYLCRHLSSCQTCYQKDQMKRCRICRAHGTKVFRIFT